MANQIIRAIEQVIIKLTIVEPLMKSFQSLFSGGLNLSGFGFNPIAGATGSAHGNAFVGGRIVPFARRGVVDSPSIAISSTTTASDPHGRIDPTITEL